MQLSRRLTQSRNGTARPGGHEGREETTMNKRKYPAFTADNAPKAGDKVILIGSWKTPERVLTVKKITLTGLVRTEEGLVYKPIDGGGYVQKGIGWIYTERFAFTEIVPYTDALVEQVREYQRKRDEEQARRRTIDEAKEACRIMAGLGNALPYETAVKILEVYVAYKEART